MKYEFIDGYRFEAASAREACEAIWHSMKFQLDPTLEDWMRSNAKVMAGMAGATLRTDSPEHHVEDMLASGILREVGD